MTTLSKKMLTENLFTKILNLKDGWIVDSVNTDFSKKEIRIRESVCRSSW